MKHAIAILRSEIDRLGGELFGAEFEKIILERTAEAGSEDSARKLKMNEFVNNLLDGQYDNEDKANKIEELFLAISVLADYDKRTKEG